MSSSVPAGTIVIWSGASTEIPEEWALCDGTNGTPDLRGRFILGESNNHPVGESGGSEEVTLTVKQLPAHRFEPILTNAVGKENSTLACGNGVQSSRFNGAYLGNNQPHPNMPPYYTLCYIMKL